MDELERSFQELSFEGRFLQFFIDFVTFIVLVYTS